MRLLLLCLLLVSVCSGMLAGQSCPLRIDRVKPNGMFEFRIIFHNPGEWPVRLTALHVRYNTITGPPYKKERRDLVSPFAREHIVIEPHQMVMLTTLPTMDAITFDETVAVSASCSALSRSGDAERVGR